jgi:hypothetical protein
MIWIASTHASLIASSAPSRSRAAQRFWKCRTSSRKPARSNWVAYAGRHRVVEEILARDVGVAVAVGHRAVHVGVDLGVAARAHALDAPRHQ